MLCAHTSGSTIRTSKNNRHWYLTSGHVVWFCCRIYNVINGLQQLKMKVTRDSINLWTRINSIWRQNILCTNHNVQSYSSKNRDEEIAHDLQWEVNRHELDYRLQTIVSCTNSNPSKSGLQKYHIDEYGKDFQLKSNK